jgi:hypothetical protein
VGCEIDFLVWLPLCEEAEEADWYIIGVLGVALVVVSCWAL